MNRNTILKSLGFSEKYIEIINEAPDYSLNLDSYETNESNINITINETSTIIVNEKKSKYNQNIIAKI